MIEIPAWVAIIVFGSFGGVIGAALVAILLGVRWPRR